MSLIELISGVEAHEATLTVFNADPEVTEELAEHFKDRNVRIVAEATENDPGRFAVLSRDGEFVTATTIAELLPNHRGSANSDGSAAGETGSKPGRSGDRADGDDAGGPPGRSRRTGQPVLDHLDETIFTSYSKPDMIAASREIEDRAWRVGRGELHAGFQTLEVLTGEKTTYDRLGEKEKLDVHAYAVAEGDAPAPKHFTVHVARTPEIRETWFVAYDGGGIDEAKCALLAEEREPGRFYGFWSYDPSTVDYVIDYLRERYGSTETTDDDAVA